MTAPGFRIDIRLVAHRGTDGAVTTILRQIGLRVLCEELEMSSRNEVVFGSVVLVRVLRIPLHWFFLVEVGDDVIALDRDTIVSLIDGATGSSSSKDKLGSGHAGEEQQNFRHGRFHGFREVSPCPILRMIERRSHDENAFVFVARSRWQNCQPAVTFGSLLRTT